MNKIGVGVIGASPLHPGWAVTTHVPVIQALADFELRAISTSRRDSALAATKAYGVPAYDDPGPLIARADVDLVVVAVKVPEHHALISAALDAGKMVFSEWPLATGLQEAGDLTARARSAGVRTFVGLQARYAPIVRYTRSLVEQGFVGEVLSTTLLGAGMIWGAQTDRRHSYLFDAANGVTTLSVGMLHALDAVNFVLGDFTSVASISAVGRRSVRIVEDGSSVPVTAADQVALAGTLRNGAVVSAFYRGGASVSDNLRWEIHGTEGDLVLTAANGNLQVADLRLRGARGREALLNAIALPGEFERAPPSLLGAAENVYFEFQAIARDLRDDTRLVPGFEYAWDRHRLLAAIERAAATGITQDLQAESRTLLYRVASGAD